MPFIEMSFIRWYLITLTYLYLEFVFTKTENIKIKLYFVFLLGKIFVTHFD